MVCLLCSPSQSVLNSHVALKLKCSRSTGLAVGHVEFQRQRADIADDQTLTTGQYHFVAETPVFRPLVGLSSSEYARAWEGAYIYVCLKAQ